MNVLSTVNNDSELSNTVSIIPNQLIVRQYPDGEESLYVYPSIFDIKSASSECFNKFLDATYGKKIFDYRNSGKYAISNTWTFDDGSTKASWFATLCKLCKWLDSNGTPVEVVFDFDYLLEMEVQFANANFTTTDFYSEEETLKIVSSYVWYFQKVMEKCELNYRMANLNKSNNLKIEMIYPLDIYKDAFRISGVQRLFK